MNKGDEGKDRSKKEELHKGFFYCTCHASIAVKKILKSANEEFNNLKRMRSREKIVDRLIRSKNSKLQKRLEARSLNRSLLAFNEQI